MSLTYSPTVTYLPGQLVSYNNIIYMCSVEATGETPDPSGTTFWWQVGLGGPTAPPPPTSGVLGASGLTNIVVSFIAEVDIAALKVVYLNSTGKVGLAQSTNPAHKSSIVGIALTACLAGGWCSVLLSGTCSNPAWSFTVGSALFLDANSELSLTVPTTGFLKLCGVALTNTIVMFSLSPSVSLAT